MRQHELVLRGASFDDRCLGGSIFGSPLVLALAFRRLADWHNAWLPTLAANPAFFLLSILFSLIGDGAATRAGAVRGSYGLPMSPSSF